jgi:hypothetical protein
MTSQEIIASLRKLADSMEKGNPDHVLRDKLIPRLIEWSVDNGHDSSDIVQRIGELITGT